MHANVQGKPRFFQSNKMTVILFPLLLFCCFEIKGLTLEIKRGLQWKKGLPWKRGLPWK